MRWGVGGSAYYTIGGHLVHLVIVCSFAPGQRRQKGGAIWLCSQNNRGNGETGTEPQGSSRQWYEALCKRDFVFCFQTSPHSLHTCKVNPFHELLFQATALNCEFAWVISVSRVYGVMLLQATWLCVCVWGVHVCLW